MISIPNKISFTKNKYQDTKLVKRFLEKISISDEVIKPYYEKKNNDKEEKTIKT